MARFYTLPPMEIPWPYVLINAANPEGGLRYLARHRRVVEAVIVDSGVEIFRDPSVREYPGGPEAWTRRLVRLYNRVRSLVPDAEVYVTVPDYPDDYHPGSLWLSGSITNIERTVDNIAYAIDKYPDVAWLIPVQGHYENPRSIERSLRLLEERGIIDWAMGHTRYFAIANLCTSRKCSVIEETVRLAWRLLPTDARIHVFGPAVNCVRKIASIIDSWDSAAWTRPRAPNGSSAWNGIERAYLFLTWLKKYADIIDIPDHPKSMRKRLVIAG